MSRIQLYRPRPAYRFRSTTTTTTKSTKTTTGDDVVPAAASGAAAASVPFPSPGKMHGYIQPLSEDGHYHLLPTTHDLTRSPTVPTTGVFERQCTPRDTNLTRYLYRLVGTVSNSRARGSLRAIRTYIYIYYIIQHIHTRYSRYTQQRL